MNKESYSKALFDLAIENKSYDSIFDSFQNFVLLYEDNELLRQFLLSRNVSDSDKKDLIKNKLSSFNNDFIYFLYVLIDNNHFDLILDIFDEFKKTYYKNNHKKEVILVSNSKLDKKEISLIHEKLDSIYPDDEIIIVEKINEDILSGYEVYIDGKKISANVSKELADLKKVIKL